MQLNKHKKEAHEYLLALVKVTLEKERLTWQQIPYRHWNLSLDIEILKLNEFMTKGKGEVGRVKDIPPER